MHLHHKTDGYYIGVDHDYDADRTPYTTRVSGYLSHDQYGEYHMADIRIEPMAYMTTPDVAGQVLEKLKTNAPKIIEMLKQMGDL